MCHNSEHELKVTRTENDNYIASDVIKAILHYCGHNYHFTSDMPTISMVFFAISGAPNYRELFKDYTFDVSRMYPECEVVNFAIERLMKSNLIYLTSPGLRTMAISDDLAAWNIKEENLFSDVELYWLKKASSTFVKLMRDKMVK